MITSERPGFGASTRLPDHGFSAHADDLAALLDALAIEALPAIAGSGGAPYLLALMAAHPTRVSAATVVSGMAPVTAQESDALIPLNAAFLRLVRAGDIRGLRKLLRDTRDAILADPVGPLASAMATAAAADRDLLADPAFRAAFARATLEALQQGADGWVDECLAIGRAWSDIDLDATVGSITWWHSSEDRNAPLTAARRLVGRLPNAELRIWHKADHFTAFRREGEILDELLLRA